LEIAYNGALAAFLRIGARISFKRPVVWGDALPLWTPEEYERPEIKPRAATVTILTPEPIVACMRHGYRPEVHGSGRSVGYRVE
jgi:hypothetical protein